MTDAADRRVALWIFLAFATLYVAVTRGHFVGTDEVTVYQTAQSIWNSGNLATNPFLPNSLPGRHGGAVGVYDPGQSVAALPLFALGRAVEGGLSKVGRDDWISTFAGGVLENGGPDYRWGGEIEIFFVNLFNAFVTALLCAVFFLFSRVLGAGVRSSVAGALLLGLATYVAPFGVGFLQHPSEALLVLCTFYFLFRDSRTPSWSLRFLAGISLTVLLLVRPQGEIAFPALAIYFGSVIVRRRWLEGAPVRKGLWAEIGPIVLPLAAGLAVHFAVNYFKFGTWSPLGGYGDQKFGFPTFDAVYGFLFSPGDGIWFFTPLLILLPWTMPQFFREHRAEAATVALLFVSSFAFYSSFRLWHGLWSAPGPRYLMPVVPILLLSLPSWMERAGRRAWLAVAPLALVGFFVQVVNVATDFAYIYNSEGYLHSQPQYAFLFIPWISPIAAETRALFSGGAFVDMWLVNVERLFGAVRMLEVALPLAALFALCVWRLRRAMREEPRPIVGRQLRRAAAVLAAIVVIATAAGLVGASRRWPSEKRDAREAQLMKSGLDLFYTQGRPADGAAEFRKVLDLNPGHYGARFQLAFALESSGQRQEARKEWKRVLEMALRFKDTGTADSARQHLVALK